jgi:predicted O-methyltransferase YrrM
VKHSDTAILQPSQAAYLARIEPARDALLAKMEARAAKENRPISDPEVASLLAVTARAIGARHIVEVGTNIGYGAIVLARAAGPEAKVVTIELNADLCAIARDYIAEAGLADRIEVRQGAAIAELERLEAGIDLAYVDCVKEEYTRYLELIVPKLSARGVILADNVLWRGLVGAGADSVPANEAVRVEALRHFNRVITTHPDLRGMILPLGDGVAYASKIA